MKKNIYSLDVKNKKVIVRCDFNVTINDNIIMDDTKIIKSLKTINYLLNEGAKIILMSHFGKVKDEASKVKNSLRPVAVHLSNLLKKEVKFVPVTRGTELTEACNNLLSGEILLIENTRFEDVPNDLESNNDDELAKYWASLGDVFINDAFGSSHRAHASVCGIAKQIPSANGFLIEEEVNNLNKLIVSPERPFTVIMGGAKVDDKLDLIKSLIKKCDYLIVGGGIANTFLLAQGHNIGKSLANSSMIDEIKNILENNPNKIILPVDVVVGKENEDFQEYRQLDNILDDELIYDIGNQTIDLMANVISKSKTIFINGTVGLYENNLFENGTKRILNKIADTDAVSIAAGGDSVSSVNYFGLSEKFSFLSTGGGASLEYIINEDLPGIVR